MIAILNACVLAERSLHIKVEEIVRCLAHLGKNKKHTVLVFVTPSCVQRIEKRLQLSLSASSSCSLIALFVPALSVANISRLLHTFHNMSKHSLFGASLFSEVDQRSVLSMLVNIKPELSERLRLKYGSTHALKAEGPLERSRSMPVSSTVPPTATGNNHGALDLTVAKGGAMFHSASVDSPTAVAAAALKGRSKAYKPKFHFRSNRCVWRPGFDVDC